MRKLNRNRAFVAWGTGWAFQGYFYPCISFGIALDFARIMVDIHFLWFTLALGRDAHITGQQDRKRHSCRGFLFSTDPEL